MNLGEDVDLEDYVNRPEKISAADIAAIAQEAGLQVSLFGVVGLVMYFLLRVCVRAPSDPFHPPRPPPLLYLTTTNTYELTQIINRRRCGKTAPWCCLL